MARYETEKSGGKEQGYGFESHRRKRLGPLVGIFAVLAAVVLLVVGGFALLNRGPSPRVDYQVAPPEVTSALRAADIITPSSYNEIYKTLRARFAIATFRESHHSLSEYAYIAPVPPPSSPQAEDSRAVFDNTADRIKTDGSYLYVLDGRELVIIPVYEEAYWADARIKLEQGSIDSFYVMDNRLVLIVSGGFNDGIHDSSTSFALVYEISNRENPRLIKSFGQTGNLYSSQLIDGTLYLFSEYQVSNRDTEFGNRFARVPWLYTGVFTNLNSHSEDTQLLPEGSVRILPDYSRTQYMVVAAIDVKEARRTSELAFLGNTSQVYMSRDSLFLAGQVDTGDPISFTKPTNGQDEILPQTRITRVSLNGGNLELAASTCVDGALWHQVSLDVHNGFLRVVVSEKPLVTTMYSQKHIGTEYEDFVAPHKLLIFDDDLRIVGSIDDLVPGEEIYSIRYLGELAYVVTLRQEKAVIALDLADPQGPQIAGTLELQGLSQFLQPYTDSLLLGITGHNVNNKGESFCTIVLYDMSDPFDLCELSVPSYKCYRNSAYLDPRALLVDAERNFIGFDVSSQLNTANYVIFGYDDEGGLYRRATIALPSALGTTRAFFIGEYLYIVNNDRWGVFDLENPGEVEWKKVSRGRTV